MSCLCWSFLNIFDFLRHLKDISQWRNFKPGLILERSEWNSALFSVRFFVLSEQFGGIYTNSRNTWMSPNLHFSPENTLAKNVHPAHVTTQQVSRPDTVTLGLWARLNFHSHQHPWTRSSSCHCSLCWGKLSGYHLSSVKALNHIPLLAGITYCTMWAGPCFKISPGETCSADLSQGHSSFQTHSQWVPRFLFAPLRMTDPWGTFYPSIIYTCLVIFHCRVGLLYACNI